MWPFDLPVVDNVVSSSEGGEGEVAEDWKVDSWAGASDGEDNSLALHWGDDDESAGSAEDSVTTDGERNSDHGAGFSHGEDSQSMDSEAHAETPGNALPFLWELTDAVARGRRMEGGDDVRVNAKARGSIFYPFPSLTVLLLFVFTHTHRMSRQALDDLFFILRYSCTYDVEEPESESEGDDSSTCREFRFDPVDVPDSGEHFLSRTRRFLPLLDVFEDTVPSTEGGDATAKVYSFPLPVILDRLLRSPHAMEQLQTHATGRILRGDEARQNFVAADHVFPIPTRLDNDRKECNLNGDIARSCALYTADGVMGSSGKKLFPGDVCSFHGSLGGDDHLCRILELYFDDKENEMRVTLRRFRTGQEVYGDRTDRDYHSGLPCVWEEVGGNSRFTAKPESLGDMFYVFTPDEASRFLQESDGDACATRVVVGAGFCERRRPAGLQQRQLSAFVPKRGGWSSTGAPRKHLVNIRGEGFHMNDQNLPYASMPMVCYYDKYNATDMTNQVWTVLPPYGVRVCGTLTLLMSRSFCARLTFRTQTQIPFNSMKKTLPILSHARYSCSSPWVVDMLASRSSPTRFKEEEVKGTCCPSRNLIVASKGRWSSRRSCYASWNAGALPMWRPRTAMDSHH